MEDVRKYDFSFTAASLRLVELRLVATHHLNGTTIDYVNELGNGKSTTGKRMLAEFSKRVDVLTEKEIELLVHGDLTTQKQVAFLSVCKSHAFIRDFVVDVMREKYLMFDYLVTDGDYLSFFRRQNELHLEMDKLTDGTQKKVRQVIFKILEDAGMIDNIKSKNIQPQILSTELMNAIVKDNRQWLKIFLMSDLDIASL